MRPLLLSSLALAAALPLGACGEPAPHEPRVVVFGIDGLDPDTIRAGIAAGRLPNFARLVAQGTLADLQTSWPPQSPVAWTNFITGVNPGKHGLYDFIHVDRKDYGVANSMSVTEPEGMVLELFGYRLPLSGGATALNRSFPAFWEVFDAAGVPAMVYRMPANFPVEPTGAETFPDMGTPDLTGASSGRAFLWSADRRRAAKDSDFYSIAKIHPEGGPGTEILRVQVGGPSNTLRNVEELLAQASQARQSGDVEAAVRLEAEAHGAQTTSAPLTFYIDRGGASPRLAIHAGDQDDALAGWGLAELGGWSEWLPLSFDLVPGLVSVSGWQRYYFKSADPLEIYGTPVQIDPFDPAMPISTPDEAAAELAAAIGPYYTQGFPDAYIAYKSDLLGTRDFISQSDTVLAERRAMMHHAFDRFDGRGGLLFFYVGSVDMRCHMLWHCEEPDHPGREPGDEEFAGQIDRMYDQVDTLLGEALARLADWPDAELVVMSDHGFAPFRRRMNVNDWLVQEGYLVLKDGAAATGSLLGHDTIVDWSRSRAYCIGFNGVILNRAGREPSGIVTEAAAPALIEEIAAKLRLLHDEDGTPVFARVLPAAEVFHGARLAEAPDVQLGFAFGYGASDDCATGQITGDGVIVDNDSRWSGSHLMDPEVVRGTLLTSRPHVLSKDPALEDVTATLYHLFAVTPPAGLDGLSLF